MPRFPERWPLPERRLFEGRYARLEPLDPGRHGNQLFEAVGGPEAERLHRWLPDPVPASRAAFQRWLVEKAASADPMFFAVIDRATGRVEGRQSLMDINAAYGSAEIGHILWGPQIAGTRVATEAFFLFADYVFGLGYRRYQWRCNALNEPSRRAALRFGYSFEGIFRQHMVVKGESRDTAWYSILDHEWPALCAAFQSWLAPGNFDAAGRQIRRLEELREGSPDHAVSTD
jgi:RimJ/RimL family protein N-acetyltransferase